MKNLIKLILSIITIYFSGCSSHAVYEANILPHMLALDRHGKKDCLVRVEIPDVDSTKLKDINCPEDRNDQDDKIIDKHIKRIIDELEDTISKNDKVELLLFVHGGMVSKEKALEETKQILFNIGLDNIARKQSGRSYIYPIFVNWESGMDEAYLDHLYRIRQGSESNVLGFISSPLYLIADFGRAFSRIPVTYGYQGWNAVKHISVENAQEVKEMNSTFYTDNSHDGHGIWLGVDNTSNLKKWMEKSTYLVPGAVKLITTPMLDMVGKSGWDNMLRRTKLLFRSSIDYNKFDEPSAIDPFNSSTIQSLGYRNSNGGLSKLMRALQQPQFRKYQQSKKLSVTLIGHSMGAIVMSELLRRFSDDNKDLTYSEIVYMAAACTIRDFEEAVIPYLSKHKETNFYNLTLHPIAEENENVFIDILPRGSLLVWIDDFASTPATRDDLTLGRWNNAKIEWSFIPKDVRKQITLKAFGIEDPSTNLGKGNKIPQKHGEFNDIDTYFWRPEFWHAPKN